jgi:replicative DNA helicase
MPATGDALLISNESYYKVSPLVTPADFYEPLHARLFEAIYCQELSRNFHCPRQ